MSNTEERKFTKVSCIAFTFTISIVLISLIPVVFPALFSETFFITTADKVGLSTLYEAESFELGILAIPLIVTNIAVLTLFIFVRKNKMQSKIETLTKFQTPKKISIILIIIMIAIYISVSYSDVGFGKYHAEIDEEYGDWERLKNRIINMESIWPDQISGEPHFKHTLLKTSQIIFGNFYVVPYMSSIGLLILTYLFTNSITNNRTAGLISLAIVLQSSLFLSFDTSATYSSFWILLYLLSLYVIMIKPWPSSPVFYLLSILSKLSVIIYGPMSVFFILNSDISKQRKILITIAILSIFIILLITVIQFGSAGTELALKTDLDWNDFWIGFTAFAFQMRLDGLIVLFLLPLTVGLFINSKNNRYATSILILIGGILLISPITTGIFNETNQPYRYLSLVVFFAIGVGLLFSKIKTR